MREALLKAPAVTPPALSIVTFPSRIPPPTAPVKVMTPVPAVKSKSKGWLRVLPKVIEPPVVLTVSMLKLLVNETGPLKETRSFVVWMLPPIETPPAPVCWKAPSKLKAAFDAVKVPELLKIAGALLAVDTAPVIERLLVAMLIPAVSAKSPSAKAVVPVPPVCVKDPTIISLLAVTLRAGPMEREVSGAVFPTSPENVTEFPAPGLIVKLRLLIALSELRVLLKVKLPPEKTRLSAAITTGEPKTMGPVWLVEIVKIVGELKTGELVELSVPVTGGAPDVNTMLITAPDCPILPVVMKPVLALRMII